MQANCECVTPVEEDALTALVRRIIHENELMGKMVPSEHCQQSTRRRTFVPIRSKYEGRTVSNEHNMAGAFGSDLSTDIIPRPRKRHQKLRSCGHIVIATPSNSLPPALGATAKMRDLLLEYQCVICLSAITRTQASVLVPCLHRFCYACIKRWSNQYNRCPICSQRPSGLIYHIYNDESYKYHPLHDGSRSDGHDFLTTSCSATIIAENENTSLFATANDLGRPGQRVHFVHGGEEEESEEEEAGTDTSTRTEMTEQGNDISPVTSGLIVNIALNGIIWCSVAETQKLRDKLGLHPLRTPVRETAKEHLPNTCDTFVVELQIDRAESQLSTYESNRLRKRLGLAPLRGNRRNDFK